MTDMENAEKLFQEYKVKEAYPLFEKLAGEGNPRAMYFMALFHQYYMECAPWSPKKAIEWALKGARLGDGLCGLFCLLHFNELSHEEYHEITDRREEWISLSQKDGSLYALEALGCYEMVNAQSEEEVDRAFHLLEEAALKNYWKAWNDLGQFHDSHVKDNPPLVRKKADNRKAIDCYRKSLEAGYPDAMNRLAYFYYTGVGVPQDKKEAYALFRKAFAKGHLRAGTALGLLYLYDEKDRDKKEGFRITKKAADAGDPVAMAMWETAITMAMVQRRTGALPKNITGRHRTWVWILPPPSSAPFTGKRGRMRRPLPFSKKQQNGDSRKPWAGWPPAISTAMVRR